MNGSPSSSNSGKTWTISYSSLAASTDYKIRVTTGVKDLSGNSMSSQYETANGFETSASSLMGGAIQGNPLNLSGTVSDLATGFSYPGDVTTDGNGNLYVADSGNDIIRKVVISTGNVSILAGSIGQEGYVDATGTSARFNSPLAITSDGTNLYVTDKGSSYVRKIVIESGVVTSLANHGG